MKSSLNISPPPGHTVQGHEDNSNSLIALSALGRLELSTCKQLRTSLIKLRLCENGFSFSSSLICTQK